MADSANKPGTEIQPAPQPGPLVQAVLGLVPAPPQDTDAARRRINESLLMATSPEQLINGGKALSFDDLFGVPVEVHDFTLLPSQLAGEGPGVFMVLEALRLDTGEQVVISTGAENVMMRLAIAKEREWLPIAFKVRRSEKETARGFNPYIVESI